MNNILTLENQSLLVVTFYVIASDGATSALTLTAGESVTHPLDWTGPVGVIAAIANLASGSQQIMPAGPLMNATATLTVCDGAAWVQDLVPATATLAAVGPKEVETKGTFTIQQQQQTNWCWAALTSSVNDFYGSAARSQGELANWAFKTTSCTQTPVGNTCNQAYNTSLALAHVNHLKKTTEAALDLAAVKAELPGNPIGAGIRWASSNVGHAVALTACAGDGDKATVTVQDPGKASVTHMPFAKFPGGQFKGADWKRTFTTQ